MCVHMCISIHRDTHADVPLPAHTNALSRLGPGGSIEQIMKKWESTVIMVPLPSSPWTIQVFKDPGSRTEAPSVLLSNMAPADLPGGAFAVSGDTPRTLETTHFTLPRIAVWGRVLTLAKELNLNVVWVARLIVWHVEQTRRELRERFGRQVTGCQYTCMHTHSHTHEHSEPHHHQHRYNPTTDRFGP